MPLLTAPYWKLIILQSFGLRYPTLMVYYLTPGMILTIRYFYYLAAPKLGRMAFSFGERYCQELAVL
jgi:hypothetical protein